MYENISRLERFLGLGDVSLKFPRLNLLVWVYGLAVLVGCFAVVFVTMIYAGMNNYTTLVTTNNWGEHYVELLLLLSGMVCFVYGSKKVIKIGVEKRNV